MLTSGHAVTDGRAEVGFLEDDINIEYCALATD